jgi:uncharacterized protein
MMKSRCETGAALVLALSILAAASAAQGAEKPSFDCGKASTPTELKICKVDALAVLDRELAALYRKRRAGSSNPKSVDANQNQWLGVRDVCVADEACLTKEMTARKRSLEEAIARFANAPAKDPSGFSGNYANDFGTVEIEAVSGVEFDVTVSTVEPDRARWVCDFGGTGQLKNGAIVIEYKSETEGVAPRTITIRSKSGALTVSDVSKGSQPDYCGYRGTIEGTYRRKS